IAAGAAHACAIAGGDLYCWGSTQLGQLDGIETGTNMPCGVPGVDCDLGAPKRIAAGAGATSMSLGNGHTCVLHGTAITCWGDDSTFQIGNGSGGIQLPYDVVGAWTALLPIEQNGACAITNGQTACWGAVIKTETPTHEPSLDGATGLSL